MRNVVCDINECEIKINTTINFIIPLRGDCKHNTCESGQLKLSHLSNMKQGLIVATKLTL